MPQLPKDESSSAQGPLQCTSALLLNAFIRMAAQQLSKYFKTVSASAVQLFLSLLHALARLMRCGCSCITNPMQSTSTTQVVAFHYVQPKKYKDLDNTSINLNLPACKGVVLLNLYSKNKLEEKFYLNSRHTI
jgi:hypothetical protein